MAVAVTFRWHNTCPHRIDLATCATVDAALHYSRNIYSIASVETSVISLHLLLIYGWIKLFYQALEVRIEQSPANPYFSVYATLTTPELQLFKAWHGTFKHSNMRKVTLFLSHSQKEREQEHLLLNIKLLLSYNSQTSNQSDVYDFCPKLKFRCMQNVYNYI